MDEINQQIEQIAACIITHAHPAKVAAIATYGDHVTTGAKPEMATAVAFFRAFVSAEKPGYAGFVARFADDMDALTQFEDAIAACVAAQFAKAA